MVEGIASAVRFADRPAQLLEKQLDAAKDWIRPDTRLVSLSLGISPGAAAGLLEAWPDRPVFACGESVGLATAARLDLERLDSRTARRWVDDQLAHLVGPAEPPIFCGAAFSPASTARGRWRDFPAFTLAVPRWHYVSDPGHAQLTLTLPPPDVAKSEKRDEALAELEHLLRCLAPAVPPESNAQPQAASLLDQSADDWERLVRQALGEIRSGHFQKLVLARAATVISKAPWSVSGIYQKLLGEKLHAFAIRLGRSTFLGATPEELVSGSAGSFLTHAIAGTVLPGREAALIGSAKNQEEHRLVVEEIGRRLAPFGLDTLATPKPALLRIRDLVHLITHFRIPAAPGVHLLDLACALHPTPAVAGLPSEAAVEWIRAHEPEPRGWYAGFVGSFNRNGSGKLLVAIRSGLVSGSEACLYTGAGIVAGSEPAAEYEETGWKQRPFLRALGIEG